MMSCAVSVRSDLLGINWPEVVVGLLLGVTPFLIRQLYFYYRFHRSPGKRRYLGHWHSYWRSTTGIGRIGHEQLEVRYSFIRNSLLVRNTSTGFGGDGRTMEYVGTISERRGVVRYWYLRDQVTEVQETWVIVDPYYDPIDVAEGVQVTVDLRGLPVATGQLISRRELNLEELEWRIPSTIIGTDPVESFLRLHAQDGNRSSVPKAESDMSRQESDPNGESSTS
jgi:hypothetical protein